MKNFIQRQLANLARRILAKHKPKIIGITGSVGKTSTRDAIAAVVSTAFSVRVGKKNFNNEFGLPFAILGVDSPGRNPLRWLWIFVKGYLSLWFGNFPAVLVLEMGIDKPGDMDYLLSIAKPDIAVLTTIGMAHYEFFKSYEVVAEEKGKLVAALSHEGTAILNADNALALAQQSKTRAKVISYGFSDNAQVRVSILEENFSVPASSKVAVHTSFSDFEVSVPAVGLPHISSVAAAIAVGLNMNISVEQIIKGVGQYRPVPGRLTVIKGIKQTIILEDSYNASPDSIKQALEVLKRMPQQKKVVVLGDMKELGDLSEQSHREIGLAVAACSPFQFIAVGELAKGMADAAAASLPQEKIKWFANSDEAKEYIRDHLEPECALLIKGSQAARMEKISKELLAEPASAPQVLPRQYGKWLNS